MSLDHQGDDMTRIRLAAPLFVALLGFYGGVAFLSVATDAQAQRPREWEIDSRIQQAQGRINRNAERGNLSRRDAKRLTDELNDIRRIEARMRRDGRLDRREREILDSRLDRLNGEITADKRR
jgi:hypothetical protein